MQTNWNIILNVLLLLGVIISIRRLVKARSQRLNPARCEPLLSSANQAESPLLGDDIIAVRRVSPITEADDLPSLNVAVSHEVSDKKQIKAETKLEEKIEQQIKEIEEKIPPKAEKIVQEEEELSLINGCPVLTMFLLAKGNRQLAGYELLQSLLSVGLCFGQGSLFHRHQNPEGQGPILCSVAAATPSGTFDLQNIGALSIKGLCLFMPISSNSTIDTGRFTILYQIATQLRDGLDAMLLDERKQRLNQVSFDRYAKMLNNSEIRDLYTRSPYF